ncbi:type IV secretory system conjugative DNA transfer family protein [Paenarthrobacter sp. NPDC056912]|uniref:type IV secretory system conjugative DNA transfer family protein n=1 Tax=Paenarthrobacter sp. NPDC056912 TaxID=3345965 RepID=UPI003671AE4C
MSESSSNGPSPKVVLGVVLTVGGLMTCGAAASSIVGLATNHPPASGPWSTHRLLAAVPDPVSAFGLASGTAVGFWILFGVFAVSGFIAAVLAWDKFSKRGSKDERTDKRKGLGGRKEAKALGDKAVLAQASFLRPDLDAKEVRVTDVAIELGKVRGVPVYAHARDTVGIEGVPGMGKGFYFVNNAIIKAPGAVLTTMTGRPDNLALTFKERGKDGRPVAVLDLEDLTLGVPGGTKWSLTEGCEDHEVADKRAAGLAGSDGSESEGSAKFFSAMTQKVLKVMLHATAFLPDGVEHLRRWTVSTSAASGAVSTIRKAGKLAHQDFADELEGLLAGDAGPTLQNIWLDLQKTTGWLSSPHVRAALSPAEGEGIDVEELLERSGTLYIICTPNSAAGAVAAAVIEDVWLTAQRLAAVSENSRLSPPLTPVLDELSNFPKIPSLPEMLSAGGGTGVNTWMVYQSRSQMRKIYGDETEQTLYSSATVKLHLGGNSDTKDLGSLKTLSGMRTEEKESTSVDSIGRHSRSYQDDEKSVLTEAEISQIRPGEAWLVRSGHKMMKLHASTWKELPQGPAMEVAKADIEKQRKLVAVSRRKARKQRRRDVAEFRHLQTLQQAEAGTDVDPSTLPSSAVVLPAGTLRGEARTDARPAVPSSAVEAPRGLPTGLVRSAAERPAAPEQKPKGVEDVSDEMLESILGSGT